MDSWTYPQEIPGWLTEAEGRKLAEMAEGKRVLEIGCYEGRSTICMAQTARHVDTVDPFDGRGTTDERDTLDCFRYNLEHYELTGMVKVHVGTTEDVAPLLKPGYDLVFIDGDHSHEAVRRDIKAAVSLLAPGGLLAFHDYRRTRGDVDGRWDPGVSDCVNDLLNGGGSLISLTDTLAIVRPPKKIAMREPVKPNGKPMVFLGMPTYDGRASFAAVQAYDLFPTRGACEVIRGHNNSSLLTKNFNGLLAGALNCRKMGITHFAMIHDDIQPAPHGWLDMLVAELAEVGGDMISAVSPIKTEEGLTSTAYVNHLDDPWLVRRLTMREVYELPETFSGEDVGGHLLLNTGLFVMDLRRDWWDELEDDCTLCFDFKNRIRKRADGDFYAETISEDWLFSQELNRRGAKLFATRKVILGHDGGKQFMTNRAWGTLHTDTIYERAAQAQGVKHADQVHAGV